MAETPGPSGGTTPEEYRQVHRSLTERILRRAASDPAWKQQLLDDPETATAEFPEIQRAPEGEAQGQHPTPEQTRQLHRSLTEKVLEKAASDPEWRQQLLDDPDAAMREANFPEAEQLEQGPPQSPRESEVVGQVGLELDWGRPRCRWCWSDRWGWYRTYCGY